MNDLELYAKRKLEYQKKYVEYLSTEKDARYFEQLDILNDLNKDEYLYSSELPVTKETWKNKYHNFLSSIVRSSFYNEELALL